jgi:CRP-like cAMP-binding protein
MYVGEPSQILQASDLLKACLAEIGEKKHFSGAAILFNEDGDNAGVFLVVGGTVCMSVKGLPSLDRLFCGGSVLGLPSSFTGRPYTLTATAIIEADIVHVAREAFLLLMLERPDLCCEATEMLGREMAFIQSALTERQRQAASARTSCGDVAAV